MPEQELDQQDRRILSCCRRTPAFPRRRLPTTPRARPRPPGGASAPSKSAASSKYCAILDREKLGYAVCAFVHISIERQNPKLIAEIEAKVLKRAEVLDCYATTGDADFTLRASSRDIADYDRFLQTFPVPVAGRQPCALQHCAAGNQIHDGSAARSALIFRACERGSGSCGFFFAGKRA
ncbi:MAG: Lrp/AsnC family transcriptional regulator [Parvularculaceae bacterium]